MQSDFSQISVADPILH